MYKDFEKRLWNDFDSQKSKFVFIIKLTPQKKTHVDVQKLKKCYFGNSKNQESRKIFFMIETSIKNLNNFFNPALG